MTTIVLTSFNTEYIQKNHKSLPEIIEGLPTHMEFCYNFTCFHTKYIKTQFLPE